MSGDSILARPGLGTKEDGEIGIQIKLLFIGHIWTIKLFIALHSEMIFQLIHNTCSTSLQIIRLNIFIMPFHSGLPNLRDKKGKEN